MLTRSKSQSSQIVESINFPCGPARHYRVQFQSGGTATWQLYACFSAAEQAQQCLDRLTGNGHKARVLRFRSSPTCG